MSVILEFTVDAAEFALGDVLSGPQDLHFELERIVPTGDAEMPFVWATGTDFERFERNVRESPRVEELLALDRVGDSSLYRIEWTTPHEDLIRAIADASATVLEATGDDRWAFRLRFLDHEKLSQFHNYCLADDLPIHVERTYTLTESTRTARDFGLTPEQREAVVLALRRGYFDLPSDATLDDLADELDVSTQALSERIRRGEREILRRVLLSSAEDLD